MSAPTLFDPDEDPEAERARLAREARDEALRRVELNAEDEWKDRAKDALRAYARNHGEFASDALWDAGLEKPHEARALGPIMLWGQKEGIIAPTNRLQASTLISSHMMPKRVWRSLIFDS